MDVIADLPADAQSAEPVQQRDGLFDSPAIDPEPGAVLGSAFGELRLDSLGLHELAVLVEAVGSVGARAPRGAYVGGPAGPAQAGSPPPEASAE